MDITNIAHLVSAVRKVQSLKVKVHILQIVIFFLKNKSHVFINHTQTLCCGTFPSSFFNIRLWDTGQPCLSHSVLRFRQTRILNCSAFCAQTAKHLRVFCRNHFFFLLKFRGNFHVPSFASLTPQHKSPWLFLIKPLKPHCRCCAYKCPSVPRGTQSSTKRRNVRESSRRRPRLENYQLQKQKGLAL